MPAAVSDAVPSVMRALSEGEPPEPPIFRVEFLADLARDEPSSQPAWTANWGRRYPDVEKVAELPYGNVGLMLSRQAVEEFEDDLAQMITRDSLVQCELEDTRGALRHIADHFRTDPSMGGPAAPSGGGATVASSGSAAGN